MSGRTHWLQRAHLGIPGGLGGGAGSVPVGPGSVRSSAGQIRVGDAVAATLAVTGYPAEVGMSWLEPLLAWPGRLDVAIHIDPLAMPVAVTRLRKQRARLESVRRQHADRGRLDDPLVDAVAADAAALAALVARGDAKLFEVGVYLTVHAHDPAALAEALEQVRACAASVLLDTRPATWRQLQGWTSTLPLGHDSLRMRRVMDSDALATSFPLSSPGLPGPLPGETPTPGGVLYGLGAGDSVAWWDRWACDNYNSLVLARSGAGKSYLVHLDILRNLYEHVRVAVIDPEDEYVTLAQAVGGTVIRLGAGGVQINPFDLPPGQRRRGGLQRRMQFLRTLIAVMIGQPLSPGEKAALDGALTAAYAHAGITGDDPATWARPAPVLGDLAAALAHAAADSDRRDRAGAGPGAHRDEEATSGTPPWRDPGAAAAAAVLASRLSPWVSGAFSGGLIGGPSTVHPHGQLVVWSTRHLPDEQRPVGMLLALDAIWRDVDTPPGLAGRPAHAAQARAGDPRERAAGLGNRLPNPATGTAPGEAPRRLVVVDEAWQLMRDPAGADFLSHLAKSGRKRRAGLAVVTQDAVDVLATDLGQIVVANCATQILMRQAPQAIHAVATAFDLSDGEARMLLTAERGQALLLSGSHRIPFTVIASDDEHALAAGWADLPQPATARRPTTTRHPARSRPRGPAPDPTSTATSSWEGE